MDAHDPDVDLSHLPLLGAVYYEALWRTIPITPVDCALPLLDEYMRRHDQWVDKVRLIALDAGVLVDARVLPGLDRVVASLYGRPGWSRPDVFVVSDIGRKGIDGWSAVSVVSDSRPIILLGSQLVEQLDVAELAFVIGHETGHLLGYTAEWRRQLSLSFLIREAFESDRREALLAHDPRLDWEALYRTIMANFRAAETRCDRLGLLVCGSAEKGAAALLAVTLRSSSLARRVDMRRYLDVQLPLLNDSRVLGPFAAHAGHPFVPYRLHALREFADSGDLGYFLQLCSR